MSQILLILDLAFSVYYDPKIRSSDYKKLSQFIPQSASTYVYRTLGIQLRDHDLSGIASGIAADSQEG
jgi:hypothetical protein